MLTVHPALQLILACEPTSDHLLQQALPYARGHVQILPDFEALLAGARLSRHVREQREVQALVNRTNLYRRTGLYVPEMVGQVSQPSLVLHLNPQPSTLNTKPRPRAFPRAASPVQP